MASSKTKAAPVGSAQWIQNERDQAGQLVSLDVEEFSFSVRNELEWLNEHMDDIFSKSQKNFADMFKTPSRMRGKTPRTTRKRDSLPARQPLTDMFAPRAPAATPAVQAIDFQKQTVNFPIPADDENTAPQHRPISRGKSPNRVGIPYVDSGYHGMTEDEMDADTQATSVGEPSQTQEYSQPIPLAPINLPAEQTNAGKADETGTSEESFVSAEEPVASKNAAIPPEADIQVSDDATVPDEESIHVDTGIVPPLLGENAQGHTDSMNIDEDNQSQSDLSSPENPLNRKSSFTFSALPAREPLGAKRSLGNRNSQIDLQPTRASTLSRSLGGKVAELERRQSEEPVHPKPSEPELRNKTSTQLLHERITMLGKAKELGPSKNGPQNAFTTQASYPQLPDVETEAAMLARSISQTMRESHRGSTTIADDDDDDWIAPSNKSQEASSQPQAPVTFLSPERPALHQKSISVSDLSSTSNPKIAGLGHAKASSVSHTNLANTLSSTTPVGSPATKKATEGTISASKNRLWSALKSAKSIFASSASASAAAKLEAHNNSPIRFTSPKRDISNDSNSAAVFNMPGALYPEREAPPSPARPTSVISLSPKRTRSSAENNRKREKEAKEQQKTTNNLEKVREKERKKAIKQQQEEQNPAASQNEVASTDAESAQVNSKPMSSFKSSILSSGKLRAPGRPVRPTRGTAQSKPAPVSIRVASQSQRAGQGTASSLSKSQHESSALAASTREGSNSRPGSAQSNKSGPAAPVNARVKALEAAARKKEADDRAAQKKAEQKRELERKRAIKAEEERRAEEERKVAEQQRAQELAAQRKAERQAAEARRREQERAEQQRRDQERLEQEQRREQERLEQQRREHERIENLRQQEDARKAREAHELAEKISRERAQQAQQQHQRGDVGGTIRQLIKHTIPQLNPAKPAKRQAQTEDEEPVQSVQRPGIQRGPPSYQQNDAKRRRTNEEQDESDPQRRSVMAPPKRPSNLRKETLSKFSHGYTHAPNTTGTLHGPGMFKAAVTAQHQLYNPAKGPSTHPNQMVQISNARIPFAENNNPPAAQHPATTSQPHTGFENGHLSASTNKFKTPVRPGYNPKSAKSSPLFQNGDNISLPDIATDSEDEGSDGPTPPSWAKPSAIREQLARQQLVDPESVFGPIATLKMDEVFRGVKNPERLRRFRDRGSSALWVESGDAVNSAEKRKDREIRERVAREGGWRYEPGTKF